MHPPEPPGLRVGPGVILMVRLIPLCDDGRTMTTTVPYTPRRATRDTTDSYLGGVASGLARHLGVPVLWVRVLFVVTAALGGMGMAFYAGLWLVLPTDEHFEHGAPGLDAAGILRCVRERMNKAARRPGMAA